MEPVLSANQPRRHLEPAPMPSAVRSVPVSVIIAAITLMLPGTGRCTPENTQVKVLVTEVRTTASYRADNHEVQLDVTRIQRPGEGGITLTFRQDGASFLMLEARALFLDPRAPTILLEAVAKGRPFSVAERWRGGGADAAPTDSADIEIMSGGKIWSNHPATKTVGVLQDAPSFGSIIPPEVAVSIAPFFHADDSSHSGTSGNNRQWPLGKGSFHVFSKDFAHWPDDMGCFAAETAIGMILDDPAADAFGKQFCRILAEH